MPTTTRSTSTTRKTIDLTRAIDYTFAGDNSLPRILIGSLLTLFVVPLFLLMGYQVRVIQRVMAGDDQEPLDWDDMGGDLARGGVVFLGTLVYYVPSVVLAGLAAALFRQALGTIDLTALILEQESLQLDREPLLLAGLCMALALAWLVLSAPLVMAAVARYAETGQFSAFTRVGETMRLVWRKRGAAGLLMLYLFVLTVLAQMLSAALSFICLIGAVVQYLQFVAVCHLNAQWGALRAAERPYVVRPRRRNVIRPIKPPR